jgi:hypothetical protein
MLHNFETVASIQWISGHRGVQNFFYFVAKVDFRELPDECHYYYFFLQPRRCLNLIFKTLATGSVFWTRFKFSLVLQDL